MIDTKCVSNVLYSVSLFRLPHAASLHGLTTRRDLTYHFQVSTKRTTDKDKIRLYADFDRRGTGNRRRYENEMERTMARDKKERDIDRGQQEYEDRH